MNAAIVRFLVAALLAASAAGARGESYLWEVASLTNRAYLFGTVHAGKKEWYPLPAAVEDAYLSSDVVVVEADITDSNAIARSASAMSYAAPDNLRRHVPPDEYARFRKLLARYAIAEPQVEQIGRASCRERV